MEKAEQDLSEIVTYFTDKLCNPKAADSLLEEFLEEKENIADNPYMYPLSNDSVLQSEGISPISVQEKLYCPILN